MSFPAECAPVLALLRRKVARPACVLAWLLPPKVRGEHLSYALRGWVHRREGWRYCDTGRYGDSSWRCPLGLVEGASQRCPCDGGLSDRCFEGIARSALLAFAASWDSLGEDFADLESAVEEIWGAES